MEKLFVFDLSCWVHRYWAKMQGRAAHGFINLLEKVIDAEAPSHVCICADLPFPNFRHDLAPDLYKVRRGPKDPTLVERLRWAEEMALDLHGVTTFSAIGYEADDLIATVVKQTEIPVVLMALDKDLMQLVDDERVSMWDGKGPHVRPAAVFDKFGVRPAQLRDYLALVGDTADCVPGVHGLGPKAAVEILTEYGTLDQALRVALDVRPDAFFKRHLRYRSILREQCEEAKLYQKLIALEDAAPIDFKLEALRLH